MVSLSWAGLSRLRLVISDRGLGGTTSFIDDRDSALVRYRDGARNPIDFDRCWRVWLVLVQPCGVCLHPIKIGQMA